MIALFNTEKKFIGYSNQRAPGIKFYKDLGDDFDINKVFWDGDYDTGELKSLSGIKLNEFELEADYVRRVKALWASEISHLLCIKQINMIAEKLDCFDENFKQMAQEVMPLVDYYDQTIKSLKEQNRVEAKPDIYEKHKTLFTN